MKLRRSHTKSKSKSRTRLLVASIGAVVAGFAVAQAAANTVNKSNLTNPEAGMSEAQRQAYQQNVMSQAHAANAAFLRKFEAEHGDPHKLPVIEVDSYAAPPASLTAALRDTTAVVIGRVANVTFATNPSGGLPVATASLKVEQVIKGQVAAVITIQQLGGPVAQGSTGALAELDNDHLLLPGDHVFLFLTADASARFYRTVLGAGVNLIDGSGKLTPEDSNVFASEVRGQTVAAFTARVVAGG